ncbi:MAG: helix-hairpin-helix domain-containing protein [Chloroflexota bacterium]
MNRENLKIISNRPAISHEQAAEVLFNCASLLQMAGANEYRIAHYRQAARTMMAMGAVALELALDEEMWPKLGLGKRLGNKVRELVRDGSMNFYVELRADLPPAVDQLMNVAGVGPRLAIRLNKELGVNSPAELADAARRGQVIKLKGFGPKRQASYARIQGPNPPSVPALRAIGPADEEEQSELAVAA